MELKTNLGLQRLKEITKELAEDIRDDSIGDDSLFNIITTILDFLPVLCKIVTPEHELIYINDYTKKHLKKLGGPDVKLGDICYATIWGRKEPCETCPLASALETGIIESQEWNSPEYSKYHYSGKLMTIPLKWNGTSAVLIVGRLTKGIDKGCRYERNK